MISRKPQDLYPSSQSPEIKLLLCASRYPPDTAGADEIVRLAATVTDWPAFITLAAKNRVLPLVYKNLTEHARDKIPSDILEILRQKVFERQRRQLYLDHELVKRLDLFAAKDLAVIPLKGALLAQAIYQNNPLREYDDIDLLVARDEVLRAKQILEEAGFQARWHDQSPARRKFLTQAQNHFQMLSPCRTYWVEPHWQFFPERLAVDAFEKDGREFWERSVMIEWQGRKVRSLHPEDYLLMLCIHGSKHAWERLGWVADIAGFLKVFPALDWGHLRARAKSEGVERMLLWGLSLAGELLKAELPTVFADALVQPALQPLKQQALRRMFAAESGHVTAAEATLFHFQMRERARDRLCCLLRRFALIMTPTAEEWQRIPLPDSAFFLYYGFRPIRLVWKYFFGISARMKQRR